MSRSSLTLPVLGAGLIALLLGLVHLQWVFGEERDEALARIGREERSAQLLVEREVEDALSALSISTAARVEAWADDPLQDATDLLWVVGGARRLPPPPAAEGASEEVEDRLARLPAPGEADRAATRSRPASQDRTAPALDERWAALGAFVEEGPAPAKETAFRRLLAHLALHRLSPVDEVVTHALAAEAYAALEAHDPALGRLLLLEGVAGRGGAHVPALLPRLVRARGALGVEGSQAILDRLRPAAAAFRVSLAPVSAALAVDPLPPTVDEEAALGDLDEHGSLITLGERRWVAWPRDGEVIGVPLDALALPAQADRLRARQLLPADAEIRLPVDDGPLVNRPPVLRTAAFERARATAERRFQQKSGLVVTCGLLGFVALGLAAWIVRRRQALLELKSDFVATVSHELRTPLAAIRLLAETLERKLEGEPRARGYPGRIVREVERLSFLVENLLSYGRVDKGRWTLQPAVFDLRELLAELAQELSTTLGPGVRIAIEVPEGTWLEADPELCRLLFSNLIRNGLSYNEAPVPTVTLALSDDGSVSVSDNGVGVPSPERERIFEPFVRSEGAATRRHRGSGLGLSLCRRILTLHAGELVLSASAPGGSRFSCRFPAASRRDVA